MGQPVGVRVPLPTPIFKVLRLFRLIDALLRRKMKKSTSSPELLTGIFRFLGQGSVFRDRSVKTGGCDGIVTQPDGTVRYRVTLQNY